MKKFVLYIFLLITFLSCNKFERNEENAFDIELKNNRHSLNISQIASKMEVTKLETSKECLLADIKEIKICDSFIYILDVMFKGIYVFDKQGNFVKKLAKEGRAEGEYLSVDDFFIDKVQNTIELLDRIDKKIYIYNLDNFAFKKTISLPFSFAFKFSKLDDIYFFQTNGARNMVDGKITNSEIISYNPTNKKVTSLFERILPENENQFWEFNNIFTYNENKLFASLAWRDKLYQINDDRIVPIIKIDAGNRAYPKRIFRGSYDDKMSYLNSSQVQNKIHFFKLFLKDDSDIIVGYGIGYPPEVCYYLRLNNGQNIYNSDNIVNDFLPYKYENLNIFKIEDNSIISVIYPYEKSENEETLNYFNICPEDNPIVLFFNIKK